MAQTTFLRSHGTRFTAACLLASVIALTVSACAGTSGAASSPGSLAATGTTGTATTGTGNPASSPTASGAGTSPDQGGAAPCANGDLKIAWGHGNEGVYQYEAVIFTNVSGGTCMLRGYPGAAITVGGTVINAVRELNGMRGDKPPLASPPLVTLTPGASASASFLWKLHDGRGCYPPGTGSISVTAPNTTKTVVLSTGAQIGRRGICSSLAITPVVPGTLGF